VCAWTRSAQVVDDTNGDKTEQGREHIVSEVFSTEWSLGDGQDQSRCGDRADPLRAQPDMA
jgi:hypothetical protein